MENKEILEMDTIIANDLSELGVPSHVYGYRFLIMAVKMAIDDAEAVSKVTKKHFYSDSHKIQYHVTASFYGNFPCNSNCF